MFPDKIKQTCRNFQILPMFTMSNLLVKFGFVMTGDFKKFLQNKIYNEPGEHLLYPRKIIFYPKGDCLRNWTHRRLKYCHSGEFWWVLACDMGPVAFQSLHESINAKKVDCSISDEIHELIDTYKTSVSKCTAKAWKCEVIKLIRNVDKKNSRLFIIKQTKKWCDFDTI